ncbi:MAG: hypothetical protein ACRC10_09455 [Thermoguttaceae bacterium]
MTRLLTSLLLVFGLVSCNFTTFVLAQDEEDVFPTILASEGMVIAGTQFVPYWAKNNAQNAPPAVNGELFVFNVITQYKENGEVQPFRVALYAYAQGENDSEPRPIGVRNDIDVDKRYSSKRPGGGLMVSTQINGICGSVSLFLPHAVYNLPPGMYQISYRIMSFLDKSGKTEIEEYAIGTGFYVEVVQPNEKGNRGKEPTRIIHQNMFETSDERAMLSAEPYTLRKIRP